MTVAPIRIGVAPAARHALTSAATSSPFDARPEILDSGLWTRDSGLSMIYAVFAS